MNEKIIVKRYVEINENEMKKGDIIQFEGMEGNKKEIIMKYLTSRLEPRVYDNFMEDIDDYVLGIYYIIYELLEYKIQNLDDLIFSTISEYYNLNISEQNIFNNIISNPIQFTEANFIKEMINRLTFLNKQITHFVPDIHEGMIEIEYIPETEKLNIKFFSDYFKKNSDEIKDIYSKYESML
jgi:hypothetical protein